MFRAYLGVLKPQRKILVQLQRPGSLGLHKTCQQQLSISASSFPDEDQLTITDEAANRLAELQAQKGIDNLSLRLSVEGGGCSGFSYVFEVTDSPAGDEDIVFEHLGKCVLVDEVSFDLVKGSKIDFTEDLIRRSFEVVDNPNAEKGCGCGSSFALKELTF